MAIFNILLDIAISPGYNSPMKCDNFALLLEVVLLKKALCLFLSLFLVVFLPACSSDSGNAPPPEVSSTAETPPDPIPESDNPLLRSGFFTGDVLSGSGKNIGTYGYTSIEKSILPDVGSEKFVEYLSEFADTKVQDSDYNWISIIFDDGTGVCFAGSQTIFAEYGNVDDEGCITELLGTYIKDISGYEYEENPIRSISNPSFKQEALVPENAFSPAPSEVFSTTAEENGLADMAFYADGEIVSRSDVGGYDTIQVATEEGDLYISAVLVDLPEISEGEAVTVYFVYTGWSEKLGGACGAYVYSE